MSLQRFSIANRLTEQAAEHKRRNGRLPRRESVPFDSVDSGLYPVEPRDDDVSEDFNGYSDELQLRVDSFEDRNVKL